LPSAQNVFGGIHGSLHRSGDVRRLGFFHSLQDDLRPLGDLVEAETPNRRITSHLALRLTEAGEGVALKKCSR
jgi:hypothetical protein